MRRSTLSLAAWLAAAAIAPVAWGDVTMSFSDVAPAAGVNDQFNFADDAMIPGGTAPGIPPTAGGAYNSQAYSDNVGPPGQTFTTPAGATPYRLTSISVKAVGDGGGGVFTAPNTWGLRISSVSGTTLTPINAVTAIPTLDGQATNVTGWLTFSLTGADSPSLDPNAQYAFDVFSSAGWFGIDATQGDAAYAGGTGFNSVGPGRSFTDATLGNLDNHAYDRTFHVALEAVPEPTACLLAIGGLLGLSMARRRR